MISALNPTWVVRVLAGFMIVLACAALFVNAPLSASELWGKKTFIFAVVNLAVILLTVPCVFGWVHRLTWAKAWWFPLLDGHWEGEVRSNWPRVKAMMEAASGEGPRFNALTDELPGAEAQGLIRIRATIQSSLFDMRMTLLVPGTKRTSRTKFMRPEWRKPNAPRVHYIYEQFDVAAVAVTDTQGHLGAAYLEFDGERGDLRGQYWTQRQGERGLNTAGSICLMRAPATCPDIG